MGVRYVMDSYGDTIPGAADTFVPVSQQQQLFAGLSDGIHALHIVSVDTQGNATREAEHYRLRIGDDPGTGMLIGTITGPSGPVVGASVSIQRGFFPVRSSNSAGDYALSDLPAGTWEMQVSAEGYETVTQMVTIDADASTNVPVELPAL